MQERRSAKRMPFTMSLEINNLYKQDNILVSDLQAPVDVVNISKTGIGFETTGVLPLGYYFNANINLNNNDAILRCVVQIVRKQQLEDGMTLYGCSFIGMADVLSYIFEEYDMKMGE